jgi:hypothetical protein
MLGLGECHSPLPDAMMRIADINLASSSSSSFSSGTGQWH